MDQQTETTLQSFDVYEMGMIPKYSSVGAYVEKEGRVDKDVLIGASKVTIKSYEENIANPLISEGANNLNDILDKFSKWNSFDYTDLGELLSFYKNNTKSLTENDRKEIDEYWANLQHDIAVSTDPLQHAIEGQSKYKNLLFSPDFIRFPKIVLERFVRRVGKEKIREVIKVDDVSEKVVNFFQALSTTKTKKLSIQLSQEGADFNPSVLGDEVALNIALFNIVRNDQKRITEIPDNPGENIIIRLSRSQSGGVKIEIQDDAGGFIEDPENPESSLLSYAKDENGERLNYQKAFVRGVTGKDKVSGKGLGLAMAREIIMDEFGGTIRAENADFILTNGIKRKGALFTIELPAVKK